MKLTALKIRSRRSPSRMTLHAGGQKYQTDCVASLMQAGPLAEHETIFIPDPRSVAALTPILDTQRPDREALLHGIQTYEECSKMLEPLVQRWQIGVIPGARGIRMIPVSYFTLYQRGALGMHDRAARDFLNATLVQHKRPEAAAGATPAIAILDSMPVVHPDILREVYQVLGMLVRRVGGFQELAQIREPSHLCNPPEVLERCLTRADLPTLNLADTRVMNSVTSILDLFEQDFRAMNVPTDETQYLGSVLATLDMAKHAYIRAAEEIRGGTPGTGQATSCPASVAVRFLREWYQYATILLSADGVFTGSDAALRRLDDVYAQVGTLLQFWEQNISVPERRMALTRELVIETGASRWKLLAGLRYIRAGYHTFPTLLRQGTEIACTIRERSQDAPADFFDGVMHSYWRTTGTPELAVEAVTGMLYLHHLAGIDQAKRIFDLLAEVIADQASTWELIPWDGGAVLDGQTLLTIQKGVATPAENRATQRFRASSLWRMSSACHGVGVDAEGAGLLIDPALGSVDLTGLQVAGTGPLSIAQILGLTLVVPLSAAAMAHSGVLSARTAVYGYHLILNPGEFDSADPGVVFAARGRVRDEMDGRYVYQSNLQTYPTAYIAKE